MEVKVVGAGGVGGCLLPTLCRVLNYGSGDYNFDSVNLSIIDGDDYEDKNRKRQSFTTYENKAAATAKSLAKEFRNLKFNHHEVYLEDNNVKNYIKEEDVVFLCVDNHATRSLVSRHCEENLNSFCVISGGNEITDGNIQVFIRKEGINKTLPLHNLFHEEVANPNDSVPKKVVKKMDCSKRAERDPQLLIANFAVASLMLNAFHAIVTSGHTEYDEAYFDISSNKVRPVKRS